MGAQGARWTNEKNGSSVARCRARPLSSGLHTGTESEIPQPPVAGQEEPTRPDARVTGYGGRQKIR
ncbi:hypothetical protein ACFRQM_16935 [Streptomyces sp. NPDC056831]|uniref:hypothetical protein n=1 Tax=Streptomyces sp. NPDC056831 TaxID=3345954 RepID=UPI0036A15FD2